MDGFLFFLLEDVSVVVFTTGVARYPILPGLPLCLDSGSVLGLYFGFEVVSFELLILPEKGDKLLVEVIVLSVVLLEEVVKFGDGGAFVFRVEEGLVLCIPFHNKLYVGSDKIIGDA